MENRVFKLLIASIEVMLILTVIFWFVGSYAHDNRIFVELDVEDHLDGVGTDYGIAMEFIDAIDFEGLENLELPDTTCIDCSDLKQFLPPPIVGNRAYIYIYDNDAKEVGDPTVWYSTLKGKHADCYAFVCYVREAEDQNIWDETQIWIRDVGFYGSRHKRYDEEDEDVEVDTIKGYEALVRRAMDGGVGGQGALGISIEVGPSELDWDKIVEAAKEGVQKGIERWSCAAKFTSGSINASVLIIPPGSLEGPCFSDAISDEITETGAPFQVAVAFSGAIWSGWEQWTSTFSGTFEGAFPSFVSFPGPSAPPTPSIPLPVISADADDEKLTAEEIETNILNMLGEWGEEEGAKEAVEEFAQWFDERFTEAVAKGTIQNLMGRGPVPTYNPPQVPNGPVENGEIVVSPVLFKNFDF
jgi:hypothetical protein